MINDIGIDMVLDVVNPIPINDTRTDLVLNMIKKYIKKKEVRRCVIKISLD